MTCDAVRSCSHCQTSVRRRAREWKGRFRVPNTGWVGARVCVCVQLASSCVCVRGASPPGGARSHQATPPAAPSTRCRPPGTGGASSRRAARPAPCWAAAAPRCRRARHSPARARA
eukprot:5497119-Prymnesium_polylepis.1